MSDHSAMLLKFRAMAEALLRDREGLLRLVDEISGYAEEFRHELSSMAEDLHCLARLLRAWATGEYDEMPIHALLALTAFAIYIAVTLGGGPPGWLGKLASLVIELVVLKAIFRKVKHELDRFRVWERRALGERPPLLLVWSSAD